MINILVGQKKRYDRGERGRVEEREKGFKQLLYLHAYKVLMSLKFSQKKISNKKMSFRQKCEMQ